MRRISTAPGDVLREEFMQPLGLSASAPAIALRVPATRIAEILRHGKPRAITADTAIRLGRYLGTTPDCRRNLQSAYDPSRVLAEHGDEIEREAVPRAGAAG